MVSLVQLEYVVAVDTYRHFATAAEKCFVTQPTLSMQLKKMEDELDLILFDRSRQPIVPTEAGKQIIEQARIVLSESRKINELVDQLKGKVSGSLSIGVIPSLAPYLLPRFIGNFKRKFPEVDLSIKDLLSEEIIDYLKKDLIDVGLLVSPVNEPGIIEKNLFYEEILVYMNETHRFTKMLSIQQADVASPDLWLLSEGHCFRSQMLNLCSYQQGKEHGLPFNYSSGSLETIKKIVDVEGGFTLLPELAREENSKGIRHFEPPVPLREVSLIYSRNFVKKRLLELLSAEIKESVPKEMLDKNRGMVVEWR